MKAEFVKDDNGFIWFTYAKDIFLRKNTNIIRVSKAEAKKQADRIQENKNMMRKKLIAELEVF